ncbi:copper resistance protein CopC [Microbacterium sp.]|uniref:copper resistance CopC family protein n=1 Tax=Microbacterium sp. TaxID=51671 RepID=UPI00356A3EDE
MYKRLSARITAIAALMVSASVVLGTTAPAAAHDEFVSAYPAADSAINGSPDEISLMFTGLLPDGDGATVIEVVDESGANVAVDAPQMTDDVITQHLSPDAATGVFTVRWKTVSADGHPISGEYVYTVAPAPDRGTGTPAASPAPEASPRSTEEPETASPAQTYGGTPSGGGAFEMLPLFFLSGLAIILGVGAIGVMMAGHRRHQRDRAQAAEDAAATERDADA